MSQKKFTNLHSHTHYSNFRSLDAITTVESLIDRAVELGHGGVAITEHDTISSHLEAIEYSKKIKEDNPDFKLILGNEIYLCRNGLRQDNYRSGIDYYYHFILLAKDEIGHRQIRELSTRAWTRSYMARGMRRVPTYFQDLYDIVERDRGHLIGSTACLGSLAGVQLQKYKEAGEPPELLAQIKRWFREMESLFGKGNFYLELQPSHTPEQIYVNHKLLEISKELDIPYIITTDAHYAREEDRKIHKAFLTARFAERETDSFYGSTYMMSINEIRDYMEEHIGLPAIELALDNIENIRQQCIEYDLVKELHIPYLPLNPQMPKEALVSKWIEKIPYIEEFLKTEWESDKHLIGAILEKIDVDPQYQNEKTYAEIAANLKAIRDTSVATENPWSAYLLSVRDYVEIMWDKGDSLVGVGRGSGGGFLLLNILGITQMNPLRETTQTFSWRFLNPERVSPLDIDLDSEAAKRRQIYKAMEETYGEDRVARILTLRTEKAKSAILTAARGIGGIDIDEAQYITSLIKADRGILHTLSQTFYGDPENGISPNAEFRRLMTDEYPDLWEVARKIEGLINGVGIHASGVIFVEGDFTETTALMRSNSGDIITQFDLDTAEKVGLIKVDFLSIDALDKIRITLDLLVEYGYVDPEPTLKETYEKILGVYNLERDDPEMWKKLWNHEVLSAFQFDQQSGLQGLALAEPTSVDDLAVINSVIRLMGQRGQEQPIGKFARFKKDPTLWDEEMSNNGLNAEEMDLLRPILKVSYGLCIAQEQFMSLVQLPALGGHNLIWADRLRKAVAKKLPQEFEELEKEFFETVREKELSLTMARYVWNHLIATNRGYGFNASHTILYSLVALQQLNLAHRFPIIFWNTANLIVDSGAAYDYSDEFEEIEPEEDFYDSPTFFLEDEEEEEDEDTEIQLKKVKKKTRTIDYGKIASAIGKFQLEGITILPPNINKSLYRFSPDVENNVINFGLSGITRIGDDLINDIIAARPFTSFQDFLKRVKANRTQIINLIKAGSFEEFETRQETLKNYMVTLSKPKKRITLQNMKSLIDLKLLPEELAFEVKVYNFNKYLRKSKTEKTFLLDQISFDFYSKNFDIDLLQPVNNEIFLFEISKTRWDKIYQSYMDKIRPFVRDNQDELLRQVNEAGSKALWDKYCLGTISKWEMDSISHYQHDHELAHVPHENYGISTFNELPEEPEIAYLIQRKGRSFPIYQIQRIAGTVLDRNKMKNLVTLMTVDGIAQVKIYGDAFSKYDKQLSVVNPVTGKKNVVEKSWFSRGNLIIVTGIRQRELFIAKAYKNTPYHLVEKIEKIGENGELWTKEERDI